MVLLNLQHFDSSAKYPESANHKKYVETEGYDFGGSELFSQNFAESKSVPNSVPN